MVQLLWGRRVDSFCNFPSLDYGSTSLILGPEGTYISKPGKRLVCCPDSFIPWKLVALCA